MAKQNIEQSVTSLLMPIIEQNSFELVDVEFIKEGPNWYLRAYIDKKEGITIDDCETVSRALEKILDEKDPIKEPYILEISSPGIDRPLKKIEDFERFKGNVIDVKLFKAVNKRKEFQGELKGLIDGNVVITTEDGEKFAFPKEETAMVRLAVLF